MKCTDPYEDIIHLSYRGSPTRPRMSPTERAAQFSPFAALSGHAAAITEAGRLTQPKIELGEDSRAILDRKQQLLLPHLNSRPEICVTYFRPDPRKEGGQYITARGRLKKIDPLSRVLVLTDGTVIPTQEISELDSPLFEGLL